MISAPDRRLNCCSSTERYRSVSIAEWGKHGCSTYTTDDGHTGEAQRTGKLLRLRLDLLRQFTGGCHDERVGTQVSVLIREGRQLGDERQHRDHESSSLTGT